MAEFTGKHEATLQETHDTVIKLAAVILDTNGNPGLASKVETVCQSHYKLKRQFAILVGFLIGSGVISGTVVGVLNGLSG